MKTRAIIAGVFGIFLLSEGVAAQGWDAAGGGAIVLPAKRDGATVEGARMQCAAGIWSLSLPGVSGGGAVALAVDGKAYPASTDATNGMILVPAAVIGALKAGNRLTITATDGAAMVETDIALTGSRRALDTAQAECPAAAVASVVTPVGTAVQLDFDPAIVAGQPVSIAFEGPRGAQDWIGFAAPGAAGSAWIGSSWAYVQSGSPVALPAPTEPGTYEVRYVAGTESTILLAVPVTVAAPDPATLTRVSLAEMRAAAMTQIEVAVDGARRQTGDYLYIARAGSDDQSYGGGYAAIPASGPVTMTTPAESGAWELRYVIPVGNGVYSVIGRAALTVE